MTEATRFKTAWQDFNSGMKNWAYRQDQLVTTHPIAGEVADTDQTFLNFDGITYGKGAAVIKQLVAAMGMDGFREGMRHLLQAPRLRQHNALAVPRRARARASAATCTSGRASGSRRRR